MAVPGTPLGARVTWSHPPVLLMLFGSMKTVPPGVNPPGAATVTVSCSDCAGAKTVTAAGDRLSLIVVGADTYKTWAAADGAKVASPL